MLALELFISTAIKLYAGTGTTGAGSGTGAGSSTQHGSIHHTRGTK